MCNFWSCIVDFEGNVYFEENSDSHNNIKLPPNLTDTTTNKDEMMFAKCEITPLGDVFEDIEKWKFKIDESRTPSWFSKYHEKQCRIELKKFVEKHILVDKEIFELSNGRYWIKNCIITKLSGYVKISMLVSSSIEAMFDSSSIEAMRDSSRIGTMFGSSSIKAMRDSSSIEAMRDSSSIEAMRDSSRIGTMFDSSSIGTMFDSSSIGKMRDSSIAIDKKTTKTIIFVPIAKNVKVLSYKHQIKKK
jgi:hypothetical protein